MSLLTMPSITTQNSSQDNYSKDNDNSKDYPTLSDLMKEQNVSSYKSEYWKKECETNPSKPCCLIYEDKSF